MEYQKIKGKKRLISIILIFSILIQIFMPLISIASNYEVTLKTSATQVKKGDVININIYVSGGSISYFEGYLDYDTDIFETVSKSNITINSNLTADEDYGLWTKSLTPNTDPKNKIVISENSGYAYDIPDDGLLATIKLTAKADTDTTTVSLTNVSVVNSSYKDVDIGTIKLNVPLKSDTYTITYNPNTSDAVTGMPSSAVKASGATHIIANGPSRANYIFTGWNTDSNGNGTSYSAGASYTTDANLDLYAQWSLITSNLTVNPNGGIWNNSNATQVFSQGSGTTMTVADPTTAPDGYTVKFNANGGQTGTLQITQTKSFDGWNKTGDGDLTGTTFTFAETDTTLEATYKANSITLPNATKDGATFLGWYTAATNGTRKGGAGDAYTPVSNETLVAQWEYATYNLTVDPNGGTWRNSTGTQMVQGNSNSTETIENPTAPNGYTITLDHSDGTGTIDTVNQTKTFTGWTQSVGGNLNGTTYTFGTTDETITANYTDDVVNLPTPTRTGYTFDGWYTSDGTKVSTQYTPTSNIILYAHWTANTYIISFNTDGGSADKSSMQVTYGQLYGTLATATKDGYVFDGWYDPSNNQIQATDIVNITANTVLTAKWEGAKYTVTFKDGEDTISTKQVQNDQKYGTLPNPTKNGYIFKGWYTATTGGNKIEETTIVHLTNNTELYAQWEEVIAQAKLTVDPAGGIWRGYTSSQTIQGNENDTETIENPTAPDGYTVTLDNNDGTGTTSTLQQTKTFTGWTQSVGGNLNGTTYTFGTTDETITANYTDDIVNLPTPTRTGYTLDGWYTLAVGGDKVNTSYLPTSNITLYAHWIENTYTITFDPDGGSVNPSSKDVTYGQTYGTLPTPEKPGYQFIGWYDKNNTQIQETDTVNITGNITLTAQWTLGTYKVTFIDGDQTISTKNIQNGDTYGELPAMSKTGYTFNGWYTQKTGGDKIESTTVANITADTEIYAQWTPVQSTLIVNPNEGEWSGSTSAQFFVEDYGTTKVISAPTKTPDGYTVTINSNGGTSSVSSIQQTTSFDKWELVGKGTFDESTSTYTFGEKAGTLTAKYVNNDITLPNATKDGYTLKGWYTAETGGTKIGDSGDNYNPVQNETIYAQWEAVEYTLTVDPNGGTWNNSTDEQNVQGTYNSTLEIVVPTGPNGYTITLEHNDGTGEVSTVTQTTSLDKWTLTGGGSFDSKTSTYTFGTTDAKIVASYKADSVQLDGISRSGYDFGGWYTDANNGTEIQSGYMPTSDITLYAHWTPKTYIIEFEANKGDVQTTAKQVTYGQTYGELPTPTRDGYTFDGWYDENNNKIQSSDIVNITENTTYTAGWLGEEYTVTFNYGDKTTTKQVRNEGLYGELPTASKEGYTFLGWFDSDDNKIESTTRVNTTSDITLYAKYQINTYTVTFYNDNQTVLDTVTVEYGANAQYTKGTPKKENVANGYVATFNGWDNESILNNVTQDLSVIATYTITPEVYTIEYKNLNNGDNSQNPTSYTIEDAKIELKDLENQEKLIFKGWYTTDDENGIKVTSIDTSKLENIILYAKWEEEHLYLKSDKYKIGENDIDIYEENDIYLDKVEPNTTLDNFISNCETNGTIEVINEEGKKLENEDLVGTNMTMKVTRFDEEITLTLVVMGDADGNGKVTATDLSTVNQALLRKIELTGASFKAMDLDDNNRMSATDLSTINNTVLGKIKLTYVK